jgi:hypothetical protein
VTRTPILRIVFQNAFVLSVLYVLLGIGVDLAWRLRPTHFIFRLSFALDALPAQALALLGLLGPLQQANFRGSLTPAELRWIFAATAIAVIFASALIIGGLMAATRRIWERPQHGA